MIVKTFQSNKNKDALKSIIQEQIYKDLQVNINNNFDVIIDKAFSFVYSNVTPTPPKGMGEDEYLMLMNKKVYNTVMPIIKEEAILIKRNKPSPPERRPDIKKEREQTNQSMFDPVLLKNYENINLIDHPRPDSFKDNKRMDETLKSFENERALLTPKVKDIDFAIDTSDYKNNNTNDAYNNLVANYNNFEVNQKNMNETVEKLEDIENSKYNSNRFTPINILNNDIQKETKKFFTSNPRNDIETFIPSDKQLDLKIIEPSQFEKTFQGINKLTTDIILEPKFKLIKKNYYIIFDSKDRDLYEYPNQTSFQVKFAPAGNNLKFDNIFDKNGTLLVREKNIVYGDSADVSILETFDNIDTIDCMSVNVPITPYYVGGRGPIIYNSPFTTLNQSAQDNYGNSFDSRYTPSTGIPINVFREPYLLLSIPEVRGPYRGGNELINRTFAKLMVRYGDIPPNIFEILFTTLSKTSEDESFKYDPNTMGKIDKMTLNLNNKDGYLYNFGIDKLFIESVSMGAERYSGYCGGIYNTTIIKIQQKNDEYIKYCKYYYRSGACDTLNSHPVAPGDVIYLYNTEPNSEQVAFFESNIYINSFKKEKVKNRIVISLAYMKDGEEVLIAMKDILPVYNNYYFVILDNGKYYYSKIIGYSGNKVIIEYDDDLAKVDYKSVQIGIAKSNLRGAYNDDVQSIFYKCGYHVISVGSYATDSNNDESNDYWSIEIDFPYQNIPKHLPNNIFFIQKKMQISYTFCITTLVKDYNQVASLLNDSGNN